MRPPDLSPGDQEMGAEEPAPEPELEPAHIPEDDKQARRVELNYLKQSRRATTEEAVRAAAAWRAQEEARRASCLLPPPGDSPGDPELEPPLPRPRLTPAKGEDAPDVIAFYESLKRKEDERAREADAKIAAGMTGKSSSTPVPPFPPKAKPQVARPEPTAKPAPKPAPKPPGKPLAQFASQWPTDKAPI
jgi:hypothetical protein